MDDQQPTSTSLDDQQSGEPMGDDEKTTSAGEASSPQGSHRGESEQCISSSSNVGAVVQEDSTGKSSSSSASSSSSFGNNNSSSSSVKDQFFERLIDDSKLNGKRTDSFASDSTDAGDRLASFTSSGVDSFTRSAGDLQPHLECAEEDAYVPVGSGFLDESHVYIDEETNEKLRKMAAQTVEKPVHQPKERGEENNNNRLSITTTADMNKQTTTSSSGLPPHTRYLPQGDVLPSVYKSPHSDVVYRRDSNRGDTPTSSSSAQARRIIPPSIRVHEMRHASPLRTTYIRDNNGQPFSFHESSLQYSNPETNHGSSGGSGVAVNGVFPLPSHGGANVVTQRVNLSDNTTTTSYNKPFSDTVSPSSSRMVSSVVNRRDTNNHEHTVGDDAGIPPNVRGMRVLREEVREHEIKVPMRRLVEETVEKIVVVPEVVRREEIVNETQVVREKIIEIARPIFHEKIVEVPEYEYVDRIVEVPQIIVQEKIKEVPKIEIVEHTTYIPKIVQEEKLVEVPEIEVREYPVERIVEVPEVREEIVIREIAIPRYVEVPVPEYKDVEVVEDVQRNVPVPVELVSTITHKVPKLTTRYEKVPLPVYAPRFIEVAVPMEQLDDESREIAEALIQQVSVVASHGFPSLCEVEDLAMAVKNFVPNMETNQEKILERLQDKIRTMQV